MLDALKALFENNVVSNEVKQEIEEAWNAKIKENKLQVTAALREEFAQKYEYDKNVMVEAIDKMVSEKLHEEMTELAEDRKQLINAKANYTKAMHENAKLLKVFVKNSLVKEVKELHEDQKTIANKFSMLETFIVDNLAKEIAEFQTDKKDLAEAKVKLVKEAKANFKNLQNNFVKKSSNNVASLIEKVLAKEIKQLKEDIEAARKNDFGRRLFEAYATEYKNSYLNEKSEISKLMKILKVKDSQLQEAKEQVTKVKVLVNQKAKQITQINESVKRKDLITELTSPLNPSQKEIMCDLLESVQTDRLKSSFDKYLPSVIEDKKVEKKAILKEGKEITGNKQQEMTTGARDNVIDIRRLAGLN